MPQHLRILFVTDAPAIGGSEVYMRELIPPLRERGVLAQVAMPNLPETAAFREELRARGITVYAYEQLAEITALKEKFDLILLSSWNAMGYRKYYATLRGPFVSLIHDQLMLYIPGLPQQIYRAFYEMLQARDIRGANHIVTVSEWAAQYLQQHHKMRQVYAVPNGVDVQKFSPASAEARAILRERFGFGRFTVLTVARMSIEKNHPSILAVARLAPEFDFVLAGSGYLEPMLRRLAPPNVRFLGKRSDVPDLYRAADVAFQPTIAENQSLATLEALASGTPVVTTDIPAQQELIQFGKNGLLVRGGAGSAAGYAAALRWLAGHPERLAQMRVHARQSVVQGHTLEQNAEALATLLRHLAAQHQPSFPY